MPLVVLPLPYRSIVEPLPDYLDKTDEEHDDGQLATVVLPEFDRSDGGRAFSKTRWHGSSKQRYCTGGGTLANSGPSWMSRTTLLNSKWTQEFVHISENLVPESNFSLACNVYMCTRFKNPISEGGLRS